MSTFVPVHDSLWTHRKTLLLAAELRIPNLVAAAHMIHLWHWAVENAPDGLVGHLPAHVLATAADYRGDAEPFAAALCSSGFVDPDGGLHNWADRNGRLIEKRREKREYMRHRRAGEQGAPATEIEHQSRGTDTQSDTASSCAAHVAGTASSRADDADTALSGTDDVGTAPSGGDDVLAMCPPRAAEEKSREQYSTEQERTVQEHVVVVVPRAHVSARAPANDDDDDDDRPTYDSELLHIVQEDEPAYLETLQGPLPCRDRDDLILLARLIWTYPLVNLIHEAQRLRARYKRAPASWPCAFDDWLREGRSVRFHDGRIDAARHGTRDYLPEEEDEEEVEEADPQEDLSIFEPDRDRVMHSAWRRHTE